MKIKIQKGLINQRAGDKLIIFDTDKSVLYTLNKTAKFIFERLSRGVSEDAVAQQLSTEYDVTLNQAKKDVRQFIDALIEKRIAN